MHILTGSAIVEDSEIMHWGTGGIHKLMMIPMSLYESGEANGKISLVDLFYSPTCALMELHQIY
ncbi:MAG: hypothetical protein Q4P19_02805 [Methanobrevibacter smithii]|nr:hypothetical protein [Methanobrevibacter smithii]MDO5829998.1 hypothetical protein [Methanobrevibacter smithii]